VRGFSFRVRVTDKVGSPRAQGQQNDLVFFLEQARKRRFGMTYGCSWNFGIIGEREGLEWGRALSVTIVRYGYRMRVYVYPGWEKEVLLSSLLTCRFPSHAHKLYSLRAVAIPDR